MGSLVVVQFLQLLVLSSVLDCSWQESLVSYVENGCRKKLDLPFKRWEFGMRNFLEMIETEITYNFLTFCRIILLQK